MLSILLATGETTLQALHAAGEPGDEEFTHDLERILDRTRAELSELARPQ
jgi:hypothetical protein